MTGVEQDDDVGAELPAMYGYVRQMLRLADPPGLAAMLAQQLSMVHRQQYVCPDRLLAEVDAQLAPCFQVLRTSHTLAH